MGLDPLVTITDPANEDKDERVFLNKRWYKTRDKCIGLRKLIYPVKQWLSLMYFDQNKFLINQTCEYCNEQFMIFEKIIFPLECQNNPENPLLEPHRHSLMKIDRNGFNRQHTRIALEKFNVYSEEP